MNRITTEETKEAKRLYALRIETPSHYQRRNEYKEPRLVHWLETREGKAYVEKIRNYQEVKK